MVKNEFLRLAAVAPNGLNPATVPAFYDTLSIKLAVISEMLASVPLISMALLTGSVYGLTQIASNMGKDHVDEKTVAPNVQETGAVMKTASVGSQNESNLVMNPHTGGVTAGGSTLPSLSVGSTVQQASANAEKSSVAASTSYGNAVKSSVGSTYGTSDQEQAMRSFGKDIGSSHETGDQWISDHSRAASEGVKLTQGQSDELKAVAAASIGIGLGKNGVSAGLNYARGALAGKTWAKGIDLTSTIQEATSEGTKDMLSASFKTGNSHAHTEMRTLQHGATEELSKAQNLMESASREASITSSLAKNVGLTQGKSVDQWSGDIIRTGRAPELASAVSGRGLRSESERFNSELKSMGMENEAQREVAGNLMALANSGSVGANGEAIYAMTGDKTMRNMPEILSPNMTSVNSEAQGKFNAATNSGIAAGKGAANQKPTSHTPTHMTSKQVHAARGGGEAPNLGVLQNKQDPGTIYNEATTNQTEHPWNGVDMPDPNNKEAHGPSLRPDQSSKEIPGGAAPNKGGVTEKW